MEVSVPTTSQKQLVNRTTVSFTAISNWALRNRQVLPTTTQILPASLFILVKHNEDYSVISFLSNALKR